MKRENLGATKYTARLTSLMLLRGSAKRNYNNACISEWTSADRYHEQDHQSRKS
jgi:hypothetical protein